MNQSKPIAVIAFDIETRGSSPIRNGVVAVGVFIGDPNTGKQFFKKRWHVSPLPGQTYEERCITEFWSKFPELKKTFESSPMVSPKQFSSEFRAMLDLWETTHDIYLLCDNPTFDAKFIDCYLDQFEYMSMQFGKNGKDYRLVHDSDSYSRGAIGASFTNQWISDDNVCKQLDITNPSFRGTKHMPEDDAEHIFQIHREVVRKIN